MKWESSWELVRYWVFYLHLGLTLCRVPRDCNLPLGKKGTPASPDGYHSNYLFLEMGSFFFVGEACEQHSFWAEKEAPEGQGLLFIRGLSSSRQGQTHKKSPAKNI